MADATAWREKAAVSSARGKIQGQRNQVQKKVSCRGNPCYSLLSKHKACYQGASDIPSHSISWMAVHHIRLFGYIRPLRENVVFGLLVQGQRCLMILEIVLAMDAPDMTRKEGAAS